MVEINLTNQNFDKEVIESNKTVLVDFWATWCGPCQMLSPILSEIAEQYGDKIKVGKVNVDEYRELAVKYQISSIPALLLFKEGKIVDTFVGFCTKKELEEKLNLC
ncbi:MAG: thioredoxin [Clostridia bacterium]|nr:thioredoxin [Clostridia bacterium]